MPQVDRRHLGQISERRGGGSREDLDVLAVVHRLIADALEFRVDPGDHQEEPEILGDRRVDGDQPDRLAVDLDLKTIERRFARAHLLDGGSLGLDERVGRCRRPSIQPGCPCRSPAVSVSPAPAQTASSVTPLAIPALDVHLGLLLLRLQKDVRVSVLVR